MIKVEKSTRLHVVGLFLILGMLLFGSLFADNPPSGLHARDFSVMTWNVHWDTLEAFPFDQNKFRLHASAMKIAMEHPNFIGIQEDFYWEIYEHLPQETQSWGYSYSYSIPPTNNGVSQFGNGLTVFHDFFQPIKVATRDWNECFGLLGLDCADCNSKKGFAFSQVGLFDNYSESGAIHFYSMHLDGCRSDGDRAARRSQINQLIAFMNDHSKGYPVILMGDFNLEGLLDRNDPDLVILNDFVSSQGLTIANNTDTPTCDIYSVNPDTPSKFDYIFFRAGNDPNICLEKLSCEVKKLIGGSDHQPIWANFHHSVNFDTFPDLTITDIQFQEVEAGTWNAYVTVTNLGPSATPTAVPIRVDVQIAGSKTVSGFNLTPALERDNFATVVIGLENCYPPEGIFTVLATVDKLDEIKENSWLNNLFQKEFTNGAVPDAPELNTPADGVNPCATTLTFTWKAVTDATPAVDFYQFRLKNSDGTIRNVSPNRIPTNYTPAAGVLQSGKSYVWQVRAHSSLGWGSWSPGRDIIMKGIGVPAPPSLIYPSGGSTITSPTPTLKWSGVTACPAVDYYDVQLNAVDGSDGWVFEHIADTSYKVPNYSLVSGKTYEWFVRAHNSQGWGNWSARRTFRVVLPQ